MQTHKDLKVWQQSISFVKLLYQATATFPKEELFGLSSQMRRAAVSIPSNIAEGYGRHSQRELLRFLTIAVGSTSELETQLIICQQLGYLSAEDYQLLQCSLSSIAKMLNALKRSIREQIHNAHRLLDEQE